MQMKVNANLASTFRYFGDYVGHKKFDVERCVRSHEVIKINQLLPLGSSDVHTKCHANPDMEIKSIVHIL